MKIGVSISIDVTKIEKSRIIDGKKGRYLSLTTFIDTAQADQYGNHGFISQTVSKEEREQNVQTPILGNCKVFYKDGSGGGAAHTPPSQPQSNNWPDDFDDDLAF